MSLKTLILTAGVIIGLTSCASMSNDYIAPPVPASDTELTLGRRIYLTKCVRCHAPEPIIKYSKAQWEVIMPEMIEDTRLSEANAKAVMRYVMMHAPLSAGHKP